MLKKLSQVFCLAALLISQGACLSDAPSPEVSACATQPAAFALWDAARKEARAPTTLEAGS